MNARRTSKYFLKDTFQTKFLVVSFVHFVVIMLTFVGVLFVPIMVQLDNLSLSVDQKAALASQFLSLHDRVWLPALVVLVLLALHSVFFSHRIAGPLYRFRSIFTAVREGDLSVASKIRKNDYLHKEAASLNDMIRSLEERVKGVQSEWSHVQAAVADLKRATDRGARDEVPDAIKHLEERAERLTAYLNQFKTTANEKDPEHQ